jgi:uracil-DNA glycosylase
MKDINLQDIKEKLFQKLKTAGWGPAMVNFIMSSDFDKILEFLYSESVNNKKWTPQIKNLFRAFEECPYDKLNVVIIGQDPYPNVNVADGIAFSCSIQGKIQKSLGYIYDSIEKTTKDPVDRSPDLTKWANQGMLMLNSALTTMIDKPGSHQQIWKPFTATLIDHLLWNKPGLIYVFLGKRAQDYADMIPDNHLKIFASHPASTGYNGLTEWDCNDLWNKINNHLEKNEKPKINY